MTPPTALEEIATSSPIQVLTTTPVDHAAELMDQMGIGDVIVTDPDSGEILGILTDRDIAVRLVARHLDAVTTEVGEICTYDPITIRSTASVTHATNLMADNAIRRLPVVDDSGKPIGIVTIEDLAGCDQVSDSRLRQLLSSLAQVYHDRRIGVQTEQA